ncbi:MAG: tRNA lysidine(34) synthetase TilS [Candidatus Pacebacteria bacterium]|nr:tRNA lysidine(34) synthetase TilS [Candidatus Paceibacterota bacterium]MDR3583671.1 tRNA lysidine(34) synthetase TilS [Candidatus Paceibacterota bacterium]
MPNLVKKVQNTIFQYSLLKKRDKIVLAVSGGPDSAAMLDIFSKLKRKYDLELIIAHVNYALRGRDSERDEKFVRELAEKYGMETFVLRPEYEKNISENYLRDIRYAFFEKIRKENHFDFIAVAHNRDDQVETHLARVIRGAGLQGLSAMRHKNNFLIRPLLDRPREEILAYLKENKLKYRIDKTNLESKFTRNKIRLKLIPYLEKNFNPNIRQTIFDSTISISEDYDLLAKIAAKESGKAKELKISHLLALHPAIQKRVLRNKIAAVKSDLKNIDAAHVTEILKMAKSTKGKAQVVVFKGLKIKRIGDRLEMPTAHNT